MLSTHRCACAGCRVLGGELLQLLQPLQLLLDTSHKTLPDDTTLQATDLISLINTLDPDPDLDLDYTVRDGFLCHKKPSRTV